MENNIYMQLAKARLEVQKKCTKKSGYNKFADFYYFELKDFLSIATEELHKVGLIALFNITTNKQRLSEEISQYQEMAILTITDGEKFIDFTTPTVNANVKGANDIQNLGSKHTYLKRYLYMNALELSEADEVDATIGKDDKKEEKKEVVKATDKQLELIKKLYSNDELNTMLERMNKDIYALTVEEASKMIKARKDK